MNVIVSHMQARPLLELSQGFILFSQYCRSIGSLNHLYVYRQRFAKKILPVTVLNLLTLATLGGMTQIGLLFSVSWAHRHLRI
jgi:hypothetical protein